MTFRKDPKPTAGAELELHSVLIATLKEGAAHTDPRTYIVSKDAFPIFKLAGVTCVLDNTTTPALSRFSMDGQTLKVLDNQGISETKVDFSKKSQSESEIFEFQTNASDSPAEIKKAFSRIKLIGEHLKKYIFDHKDFSLISVRKWVEDFNTEYKAEPELQITLEKAGQDMFIATASSVVAIQKLKDKEKSTELKYAPQFNFSVAIDMLGEGNLEDILAKEIEESLKKMSNFRKQEFQNKKQIFENKIEDELKNIQPDEEKIASFKEWVELYNKKLKNEEQSYAAIFKTQREIIKSARETANKAASLLTGILLKSEDKLIDSAVKLKKLTGLFFILNYYVRTEAAKISVERSTPKNKYLFFIKHKMSEIVAECLSQRDKTLLARLKTNPVAQNQILTLLAGTTELLNSTMYNYPKDPNDQNTTVTFAEFLKSSLGWNNEGAAKVCDKLPIAGKFIPPIEPPGHHKKHLLSRLVIELRWPGEDLSLQDSEKLMLDSMRQASTLNETTFLRKSQGVIAQGLGIPVASMQPAIESKSNIAEPLSPPAKTSIAEETPSTTPEQKSSNRP